MTDRELLEMAAKASGCEVERYSEKYGARFGSFGTPSQRLVVSAMWKFSTLQETSSALKKGLTACQITTSNAMYPACPVD